ncbi:transposase [Sphingomonas sp. BAUL-RG-20F-R05-02]|uniref:transposase n=1 Tax=Sphingomonas sp. BAUL-RG-20F-R05-02 TaxID=2914830 RepID=UPI001F595B43|nr:transposase [Sphingomonas sp. BAUL-RG-20F-R05-02]
MCLQYIAGLISPGDRKSVQLMTAWGEEAGYDELHHFQSSGDTGQRSARSCAAKGSRPLVGGTGALLVIDDTVMPKKGRHSVGVVRQYIFSLGKNAKFKSMIGRAWHHVKCR